MASIIEDITIPCKSAEITPKPDGTVDVKLIFPEKYDIIDFFDPDEIIDHFGKEKVLSLIDKWDAQEYYMLPTQEDMDKLKEQNESLMKDMEALRKIIEDLESKNYIEFEETKQ